MKLVKCEKCKKNIKIKESRYKRNLKKNYKFFCSSECRIIPIENRFWEKVNKTKNKEDCWEWNSTGRGQGYGAIKYQGKVIDAHRLSYLLHNNLELSELTSEDFICHTCDNRKCVNPNHLFLGNAQINAKDAYDKGRITVPKGNKFKEGNIPSNSKLTKEQVNKIKELLKTKTIKEISEIYNVKDNVIKDISCGRTYKS